MLSFIVQHAVDSVMYSVTSYYGCHVRHTNQDVNNNYRVPFFRSIACIYEIKYVRTGSQIHSKRISCTFYAFECRIYVHVNAHAQEAHNFSFYFKKSKIDYEN